MDGKNVVPVKPAATAGKVIGKVVGAINITGGRS